MTKKKKHRHRLHVAVGPAGTCPDCGKATPFHRASLLDELRPDPWVIDVHLLRALAATVGKKGKVVCSKCGDRPGRFHWLELGDCVVLGPFCAGCLRDQRHDLPLYVASASKGTLLVSKAVTTYAPRPPKITVSDAHLL